MSNKTKTILLVVLAVIVFMFWFFIIRSGEVLNLDNNSIVSEGEFHEENKNNDLNVSFSDLVGGGVAKDGIPSIDDPKFVSVQDAEQYLPDQETGIIFTRNGINRFYPLLILAWHEIVNDTVDGERILVTYCPLCFSGIVYDPIVNDERVEFGVSGKLWNSNLVMYDRKTDSLWSQVLGEAIIGDEVGSKLEVLEFDHMEFGDWKLKYPEGQVLSKNTGAIEFYGQDPYGEYYSTPGVYFGVNNDSDSRLEKNDSILGILVDGKAKAYLPSAIKEVGQLDDQFASKNIFLKYDEELDIIKIYEKKDNGSLVQINPFSTFWFAWSAVHPETELYK